MDLLVLPCINHPSENQTKKAKRFGEGFTWTCYVCGGQKMLVQGKGNSWRWVDVNDIQEAQKA